MSQPCCVTAHGTRGVKRSHALLKVSRAQQVGKAGPLRPMAAVKPAVPAAARAAEAGRGPVGPYRYVTGNVKRESASFNESNHWKAVRRGAQCSDAPPLGAALQQSTMRGSVTKSCDATTRTSYAEN